MTESEQRRRLAAAFRWSARLGFNEAVANHFSALVPGSDQWNVIPADRFYPR